MDHKIPQEINSKSIIAQSFTLFEHFSRSLNILHVTAQLNATQYKKSSSYNLRSQLKDNF